MTRRRVRENLLLRWLRERYQKSAPPPAPRPRSELRALRERNDRIGPDLVWEIHCNADPVEWVGHWYGLTPRRVREIQRAPNEGTPWTDRELAELGPGLRSHCEGSRRKQRKAA